MECQASKDYACCKEPKVREGYATQAIMGNPLENRLRTPSSLWFDQDCGLQPR